MNADRKKSPLLHLLWIVPLLLIAAAAAWVLYTSYRYETLFLPGTEILGVDCSSVTAEEASLRLDRAARGRTAVLRDEYGTELARISLGDFLERDELPRLAASLLRQQRAYAQVLEWLRPQGYRYAPELFADLTEERTEAVLRSALYDETELVEPRDAYIDLREDGYDLVSEVEGNVVHTDLCAEALTATLRSMKSLSADPPVTVVDGARELPRVYSWNWRLVRQMEQLDEYTSLALSLDFENGNYYTLSAEDLLRISDITVPTDTVAVTIEPREEAVRAFVDELMDQYASDGVDAKFGRAAETREYVYYRVGDRGWKLDREAMEAQVLESLRARRDDTVYPTYDRTWYWKEFYKRYGVGDTFVEISLDNQYLWFFVDGELLVETPVVTGNVANYDNTRLGCFRVKYKQADTILRGPTWNDHVDYWIPFDGQIGLHDSSWRDEYGGDIYLTDGSHGCVNTPLAAMRIIFSYLQKDDIVIVY